MDDRRRDGTCFHRLLFHPSLSQHPPRLLGPPSQQMRIQEVFWRGLFHPSLSQHPP